jgi:spermidine/putrescine transport system permease protein
MMWRRLLAAVYWGALAIFALPLALIALTSLAQGSIVGFPMGPSGLHWYGAALADPAYRHAFALSAVLAFGSALLAVVMGCWIALAAASLRWRWMQLVLRIGALVPLVTPGIVHAVALRIAIRVIGLDPGFIAILLGHAIHATPYATIMAGARLATLPAEQVEAARTLGARPGAVFLHVIMPWLRPALLGAGGLAALSSFDDFIRSFFLGGYDPTLPVLIFGRLRSGLTPEINAVATIVLLIVCFAAAGADRIKHLSRTRPALGA